VSEETGILYLWQSAPRVWQAHHPSTGLGSTGIDRDEALRHFSAIFNDRQSVRIIDSAPPRPRREGEPIVAEAAVTADEKHRRGYAVYRELLKAHHPDACGKRTFTGDEITAALIRLWQATQ